MNRRGRVRRGDKHSKSQSHSPERSPLQFSDEEEEEEEDSGILSTNNRQRRPVGGRPRQPLSRSKSVDETYQHDDEDDDEEDDSEEEERRGRRSLTMPAAYGAASYLPTAYGAGGGLGAPDGGPHVRERSVDRIRARTNDRRRDFSKERGAGRRDRSTSRTRSNITPEQQKANERAAQRRRDRRASLEASLGMMNMDDSASSFGNASVSSMASEAPSALLINGMDSSISNIAPPDRPGRRPRRTQSRDSTSTDYTADRRQQQRGTPKQTKTWDGRLDNVLNKRRQQQSGA